MGKIDRPFFIALLGLIAIGLLMVFSSSMYTSAMEGSSGYDYFIKQLIFAIVGVLIMLFISKINYRVYKNTTFITALLFISIILLGLVLIPGVGIEVNDARRWLPAGITNFQPSEIAKIVGILFIASTITNHPGILARRLKPEDKKYLYIYCYGAILCLAGLTIVEPSMSAAVAIGFGMVAALFFSGIPFKRLCLFLGVILAAGVAFLFVGFRLSRILAFINGNSTSWQASQSMLAFNSGGAFGVGLGNGKQKLLFLPEIENDFIFANIGEEFGFIGCLFVLALYAFFLYRGFQIAIKSQDRFAFIYTASMMSLLGFQIIVNIGVATSMIPVTGMALPFISYGGSSMLILLIATGPILNISRELETKKGRVIENSYSSGGNWGSYLSRDRDSRRTKKSLSKSRNRLRGYSRGNGV